MGAPAQTVPGRILSKLHLLGATCVIAVALIAGERSTTSRVGRVQLKMEIAVVELLSVDEESWQPLAGSASVGVGAWPVKVLFFSDFQRAAMYCDDDKIAGTDCDGAGCSWNARVDAF